MSRAPRIEVIDDAAIWGEHVASRAVAPVGGIVFASVLVGGVVSRLAGADGGEEFLFAESSVAVEVEEAKGESHAPEGTGEDQRGETDDELAEVDGAIAVAVPNLHEPVEVHVVHQAEHARQLVGVHLAVVVRVGILEEPVSSAQAPLGQKIHLAELRHAELIRSRANFVRVRAKARRARPHATGRRDRDDTATVMSEIPSLAAPYAADREARAPCDIARRTNEPDPNTPSSRRRSTRTHARGRRTWSARTTPSVRGVMTNSACFGESDERPIGGCARITIFSLSTPTVVKSSTEIGEIRL